MGRAVDSQDYLEEYKKQDKESDEDYRKRLQAIKDVGLNEKDLDALVKQVKSGKTILDLIKECIQNWPSEIPRASYRT